MSTVCNSVRIVARGLSAILGAAAMFATPRRRGATDTTGERRARFGGVHVATAGGYVGVEATDPFDDPIRFHAMATVGGDVDGVSVSIDADTVAGFARSPFDFLDVVEGSVVSIDNGRANMPAVDPGAPEDWATVDFSYDDVCASIHLEPRELRAIVDGVAAAVDDGSARYALGGVLFDVAPRSNRCPVFHAVGTDGRRIHVATFGGHVVDGGECAAIVPRGALVKVWRAVRATVPRAVSATSPVVRVSVATSAAGRSTVRFNWKTATGFECTVDVHAVEGRFPRWRDCFGVDAAGDRHDVKYHAGAYGAAAIGIGDADGAAVETFAAPFAAMAETVAGALRGACRPEKRGDRPAAVAFAAGSPIAPATDGGPRRPRMHVATSAGSVDVETDGAASPGFDVSLDPQFVDDVLGAVKLIRGIRGDADGGCETFATPRPEKPGQFSGVHIRAGRGLWARDGVGFAAVIMPVARS